MQRRYVVRGEEVASRVDVAAYGQDEFVLRTQVCVEYNATLVYTLCKKSTDEPNAKSKI